MQVDETSLTRQCEKEYLAQLSDRMDGYDAAVSLACGVGPSTWRRCTTISWCSPGWTPVSWESTRNGASTPSAARPADAASWRRPAASAPSPVVQAHAQRSLRRLRQGQVRGQPGHPLRLGLIYERLKTLGQLDRFERPVEPKDWTTSRDGGPRKIVREDLRI